MSVHHRWSQIATVKAMTITADSLLPRPKLDCDVGYNVAMKGVSVVVYAWIWVICPPQCWLEAQIKCIITWQI